jgi:CubicO group peptidase (beta-lactamase class C family)
VRGVIEALTSALVALCATLLAAPFCPAATPEQLVSIDRLFSTAYPSTGPGAAVLVVQNGKTLLRKGYGMAEIELGVPIAPDMVFRVGSVTKEFTAACVLRLAEEGRLALDDPVEKYLPEFPNGGRRVTIEQLLTHTSGIRSYTDMPGWFGARMREDRTPREVEALFDGEPFDFEPGKGWHYDNSGYVLLGEILEKVTGKPYAELVTETIFRPLGMNDTRYGSDAPIVPKRVAGYVKTPDGVANAPFLSMTQPYAAGALVSTVDDLARWHRALDEGAVLKPESVRRMWTPARLPDGTDTRYGFGWIVWSLDGHPVVEHGGGINGFQTANLRLPDERIYVAVLSNCGGCADPRSLALSAATLVAGRPWAERPAAGLATETLDHYAGRYRDADGDDWVVEREDDHLVVTAGRRWRAWPFSENAFFFRDAVREIRFVLGPDGAVTGMEIDEKAGPVELAKRVEPPPSRSRRQQDR